MQAEKPACLWIAKQAVEKSRTLRRESTGEGEARIHEDMRARFICYGESIQRGVGHECSKRR